MEFKRCLECSNTIKFIMGALFLLPVLAKANTDPFVFSGEAPYYVRVNSVQKYIDLGDSARTYDFGKTGGLVSSVTGKNNAGVLIAAMPSDNIIVSGPGITSKGIPGRIEPSDKGLKVGVQYGDGVPNVPVRAQVASFALPADQRLFWNLQVQFGKPVLGETWNLTPSGLDPVLIWQIKAPNLQPSLAVMVDTDDTDRTKLMLFFSIKNYEYTNKVLKIGVVRGLLPYQPVNILMEAVLDEKEIVNGGKGFWRVKVNNQQVVDYSGPTLVEAATEPHQWFFGVYRYLTYGPVQIPRMTYWNYAQMLRF
ncbi:MAG: hypothetical protein V4525_00200 [Pseudomonadota bacterium]